MANAKYLDFPIKDKEIVNQWTRQGNQANVLKSKIRVSMFLGDKG
jgi:hypothetical protein